MIKEKIIQYKPVDHVTSAWDKVKIVRNTARPSALHLLEYILSDFTELHGDRVFGDDKALVGGIGMLDGIPITVIAQERGRNQKEHRERNYAMPHPEGYRKAKRLAAQAERFRRPILCVVDTPGAYPGIGAEERGQAEAIAQCLLFFSAVYTPVITVVLGQGGSGGALALCMADRILMLENATFSVISPEGFASIYWKDSQRAREASEIMKMTSHELLKLGVVDEIIPEYGGGLHNDKDHTFASLKTTLKDTFKDLMSVPVERLVKERYSKLRYII